MAFTAGGDSGNSNSTTPVEIVAAPGAGQRIVTDITVVNTDTTDATVTISFDDGTTDYTFVKVTLSTGDQMFWNGKRVLETTDSINLVLAGAITTNQIPWHTSYGDAT